MLSTPIDTLGWIILKARAVEQGLGEIADEDDMVLGDQPVFVGDADEAELSSWIADLTDTQKAELIALFWLGRDDGDPEDMPGLIDMARERDPSRAVGYLLGSPFLADYLEDGLERLGYDVGALETALV